MSTDYYNILGVGKNASQEEIKKAFRQKAHQFHPDKAGGDEAKFKEVNQAYQVLGNPQKRAQYDQFGPAFEQARASGGFSGFNDFRDFAGFANGFSGGQSQGWNINMDDLGDIFGGIGDIFGFGSSNKKRSRQGNDIEAFLVIDFLEAVFGTEKEFSLQKQVSCSKCQGSGAEPGSKIENCQVCGGSGRIIRQQRTILGAMQVQSTCQHCSGQGKIYSQLCSDCRGAGVKRDLSRLKVKIPAGIDDGETIRLSGQGEAGGKGAPAGDLYLKIRVNSDSRFERRGYDIASELEISFNQAALGDKIEVATVDGPVKLKIPEGTQPGTIFKLKDKGVPRLRSRGRGDQLVEIKVKIPKNLTKKQKELLRELGL